MKVFRVYIYKYFIAYLISTFVLILIENYKIKLSNISLYGFVIIALLVFIFIVPYFEYTHLIVDNEKRKIIFKRERFLLKKKEMEFDLCKLLYSYKDEYAGLPSKEKVFSIYENGKKVFRLRATKIGHKLLDSFVNEIERVKKEILNV
ncbi:MAG TPA: hypothetical protein PKK00_07035 [Bacteroidales bacterium]|nr:hypothetical protein [Bacteroidales bacterium]HPS17009.1 hypothetical protein [Bacteroidales bacterium]